MALATQCPHCHTTFRVAHDQLKLRSGLVRCGSCKEIFNGIEHLLPSETMTAKPSPAANPTASAAPSPTALPAQVPAPAALSAPASPPAAPAKPSASDQLDFAYPDMGEEEHAGDPHLDTASDPTSDAALDPIPDTIVEPHHGEPVESGPADQGPVEVEFIEIPRKTPLPTPAVIDPEPAYPLHGEPPAPSPAAQAITEDEAPADPLTRMTLIDVEEEGSIPPPPNPDEPDPLDKVMEDFERKPARGKRRGKPYPRSPILTQEEMPREEPSFEETPAEEVAPPTPAAEEVYSEAEEPDFVKRERHKRTRGRAIAIAMNTTSVLLVLLALGQGAYIFRDQLAVRVPELKPALQSYCAVLDCKIGLPTQIDEISIEPGSDHLEKIATRKDTSELTLVLHNAGSVQQSWPQLELTLNDDNNVPLARRVFSPQDYLPASTDPQKGFAANAEQPVKLYIEFADAKPAGYNVGVFYR